VRTGPGDLPQGDRRADDQDADGYTSDSLELGRLKATDGSFNYRLPAGTDPAEFASALIWCKQFAHLFAVAPLVAG
jgi:hypothetical protein